MRRGTGEAIAAESGFRNKSYSVRSLKAFADPTCRPHVRLPGAALAVYYVIRIISTLNRYSREGATTWCGNGARTNTLSPVRATGWRIRYQTRSCCYIIPRGARAVVTMPVATAAGAATRRNGGAHRSYQLGKLTAILLLQTTNRLCLVGIWGDCSVTRFGGV
jgi:hypothetical protein